MSAEKIKRLRELVKEVTRGTGKAQCLHIPPDYEHDADLVISWAADRIEVLEKIVNGKATFTRDGVVYRMQPVERRSRMQPVERRSRGRRTKDT